MLSRRQRFLKRSFDITAAAFGLLLLWPIIAIGWFLARRASGTSGFFLQTRIGRGARPFTVIKLRTMRGMGGTSVTTATDARITPTGAKLRRWKVDELPQLWNVLVGDMSFVGPRPDVPGFLDQLQGPEQALWQLRPGITGPATLQFRREEELLATTADPEAHNREVIWPEKVRLNLAYLRAWSLSSDLRYIKRTLLG